MESLWQDIRFGFRNLMKTSGLTAVAVITLALGIGANSAIFSIVDAVLLRPLPFRNPGQLVRLYETEAAPGHYPMTGPDFLDWKTQAKSFQDMTLVGYYHDLNLSDSGTPEHILATPVESNYFALLDARPILGRTFLQGEDEIGKDHVAILSYALWKTHFGEERDVINRVLSLNNEKYTIIGVMAPEFRYPSRTQLWIPQDMDLKSLTPRGSHWAQALGRLKPDATVQQAQSELTLIAGRLEKQYPGSNHKVGAYVAQFQEDMVRGSRDGLVMMLWAVVLVLLIACANVANLLLSRAVARQKEIAIRNALGAGRARLVRQLLTESVMLALFGAVLGLGLAWGGIKLMLSVKSLYLPPTNPVQLNAPVLLFTLAIALLAGLVFGIAPALHTSGTQLNDDLRGGAGSSSSPTRSRRYTSNVLVVTEVGLSILLLISAGLLLKDFAKLRSSDIGVRTDHLWTATLQLPESSYKTNRQKLALAQALLERASHLPGVEAAAITDHLPLEGGSNGSFKRRGQTDSFGEDMLVEYHSNLPGYFHAMGIPILAGRDFTQQDVDTTIAMRQRAEALFKSNDKPPADQTNAIVMPSIINKTMADYFWKGQNPIGQMYGQGTNGPWREVIGVVGDVKQWGVTQKEPQPEGYTTYTGDDHLTLVLHTSEAPEEMTAPVRRIVSELDTALPLYHVRTMREVMSESTADEQIMTTLLGVFASLALLLAAVGIYGVLSYSVTQRTREIGIRMSLGANRGNVVALVLGQGSRLVVLGFVLGIAGAFAARRLLAHSLHTVGASDPLVYVAAPVFLAIIALLACYIPARRAARVDPIKALRQE